MYLIFENYSYVENSTKSIAARNSTTTRGLVCLVRCFINYYLSLYFYVGLKLNVKIESSRPGTKETGIKMKRRNAPTNDADVDVESAFESSSTIHDSQYSSSDATSSARGEDYGSHDHGHSSYGIGMFLMRKLTNYTAATSSPRSCASNLQSLLTDILLGTVLGVFFLLSLFYLDYHHILNIGSAKSFHNAALAYVTHPDTIQSMEQNFDIKIIPLAIYTNILDEITKNTHKVTNSTSLTQVEEDLAIQTQEMGRLEAEYDQWIVKANAVLNLDNWCGSCKGPWGRCRERVDYLMVKYGQKEWKSQSDLISAGHCLNDQNLGR